MDEDTPSVPTSDPVEALATWTGLSPTASTQSPKRSSPAKRLGSRMPHISPLKKLKHNVLHDVRDSTPVRMTPRPRSLLPASSQSASVKGVRQPFRSPVIRKHPTQVETQEMDADSFSSSMTSSTAGAKIRTLASELQQLNQAIRLSQPASAQSPDTPDDLLVRSIDKWRTAGREVAEAMLSFGQQAGWTGPSKKTSAPAFSMFDSNGAIHQNAGERRDHRPSWGYDEDEDPDTERATRHLDDDGKESLLDSSQRELSQDIPSVSHATRVPKRYGKLTVAADVEMEDDAAEPQPVLEEHLGHVATDDDEGPGGLTMTSMLSMFGISPALLGWSQENEDWMS